MDDFPDTKRMPRKILGMKSKSLSSTKSELCHFDDNLEKNYASQEFASMDRMRFPSMMNQDLHAIWPYGAIMSPVVTTPSLAIPYGLTPSMRYVAMPHYPAPGNGSALATGGSQQQPQTNPSGREPNNMMIQIGVQCVNQNNPVNFNSVNDMTTSTGRFNLNCDQSDAAKREDSLSSSPISSFGSKDRDMYVEPLFSRTGFNSDSLNSDFNNNTCSAQGSGDSSRVVLSQIKFEELKNLALAGSEIAEKLAYAHRNRPCFKKIDSLCARMKQDLIRPDGVLPNINSQGIAWAVKDFIFVFTRVINAWIIIKGYVYNTPEGLNKVRSALSSDFVRSFADWQDSTLVFVENLMKSFINLDDLVQAQKNVYQKVGVGTIPPTKDNIDEFDLLSPTMESDVSKDTQTYKTNTQTFSEGSEQTQRQNALNGTYFKTGTYNFIKRNLSSDNLCGLEQYLNETLAKSMEGNSSYDIYPTRTPLTETDGNYGIRVLEKMVSEFSLNYDPNVPKPPGTDLVDKLNVFIRRLMKIKSADLFFKTQFCSNYFPDFIAKTPDFKDIRTVILKCLAGGYGHIFEAVHDIRLIIYQARLYLKSNNHPELDNSIMSFQIEFDKMLTQEPFANYQLDHIKGKPNEVLYSGGK